MQFSLNHVQILYENINPNLKEFSHLREVILKARQLGFSTYIAGKMFIDTMNTPNTQSIMIAQDEENSKRLFQMITRFYDNLHPTKKRIASGESTTYLHWADIDSYFYVGWAGSKKLGRSGTFNNVHASEISRWENPQEIVAGLFNAVPAEGNIFLESTANGFDNYFAREYKSAEAGESRYTARFFPWFLEPTYMAERLVLGGQFERNEEEERIAELVEKAYTYLPDGLNVLTDEQFIWRRNKIVELRNAFLSGDDSMGMFEQEFPTFPDEAFLTTGISVFDKKTLDEISAECSPPLGSEAPTKYGGLALIKLQQSGRLQWWKKPQNGHRYVITSDPAGGLNENGDNDYCSSDVIDIDTWEQVATLHGRWEPHEYANLLAELGDWYNRGLIVVLSKNHGHAVLTTLINVLDYRGNNGWGGVYFHKDYDAKAGIKPKPGYDENKKTKGIMISALIEVVHDKSIIINSKQTVGEMRLYSKLPGLKMGASTGHDDRVSSLAVGIAVIRDPKFQRRQISREKSSERKVKIGSGELVGKSNKRGRML